jgi:hypothetical protein
VFRIAIDNDNQKIDDAKRCIAKQKIIYFWLEPLGV